jgi:hypothetical protein
MSADKASLPLDEGYRCTLVALFPGVALCAVLYWLTEGGGWLPVIWGCFVLGALPGLPILGLCLSRLFPTTRAGPSPLSCVAWMAGSLAAPLWHCGVIEISFRVYLFFWLGGRTESFFGPEVWCFLVRYACCLWATTAGVWLVYGRRKPV